MSARALMLSALLLCASATHAGTACRQGPVGATEFERATQAALVLQSELDRRDRSVALIARVGQDLSRFGLKYSHVAFVVRDHPDGRWTVVQLLNECGTDHSGIYADGLVNFYLDDLVNDDTAIVWLQPVVADRVARELASGDATVLHQPHYSAIARPDSLEFQNCTSWVLETLELVLHERAMRDGRAAAHRLLAADGFRPDVLEIPYLERLAGAVGAPNVSFVDHPLSARLGGHYRVVTVDSIFRYLERQGVAAGRIDFDAARVGEARS